MNLKKLASILLIGGASYGLFLACDLEANSCLTDTDCPQGEVCEGELCVPECTDSTQCAVGEACIPRPETSGSFCEEDPDANNQNNGNNGVSNNGNNGNNGGFDVYVALIRDQSFGDDSCDNNDPGSDLAFVALETETGAIKGYGELVTEGIIETGSSDQSNIYSLGGNLDGSPPSFGANCPEFMDDYVTALGCGGFVAVQFLNGGQPVPIELGDQIRVFEYGSQCDTGSAADEYDVFLCGDTDGIKNNDDTSSCSTWVGGGGGEVTATVTSLP